MLVTSIEITNHSNTIVSFKGLNFYILIQANQSGLECNIPADNALQNIARLKRDAPYLDVTVLETGEGVPTDNRFGIYIPSALYDENYQGVWDASGATAPSASPEAGHFWMVSVGGTKNLDGVALWYEGDYVKWTGERWMRVVSMATNFYLSKN